MGAAPGERIDGHLRSERSAPRPRQGSADEWSCGIDLPFHGIGHHRRRDVRDSEEHYRPPRLGSPQVVLSVMTDELDLPCEVTRLLGTTQYQCDAGIRVERGYIWTTCASVQNGNPLFWDDAAAEQVTDGHVAPPTMLSV